LAEPNIFRHGTGNPNHVESVQQIRFCAHAILASFWAARANGRQRASPDLPVSGKSLLARANRRRQRPHASSSVAVVDNGLIAPLFSVSYSFGPGCNGQKSSDVAVGQITLLPCDRKDEASGRLFGLPCWMRPDHDFGLHRNLEPHAAIALIDDPIAHSPLLI
jgi:hypothetical protein